MIDKYDLIVVGAGSGGVRAARIASSHGAKVAIFEKSRLGGTCVMRGCIPKKLLVYGSNFKNTFQDALSYGWSLNDISHDWSILINKKNKELDRLEKIYETLLLKSNVDIYNGEAKFKNINTIEVGDKIFKADNFIISTGGYPKKLDLEGGQYCINSDEALDLKVLPKSLIVVGGGYIALELANIYALMGTKVQIIHRSKKLLRGFDEDLVAMATETLKRAGVIIHTETEINKIKKEKEEFQVYLSNNKNILSDKILCAIGRIPASDNLGLNNIGVKVQKDKSIYVDANLQTSKKNIFAIGDVTNRVNLTPVAIAEGHALADKIFSKKNKAIKLDNIGTAVFTSPPLSSVGLSEQDAIKKYKSIDVYESKFRSLKNTLSNLKSYTYIKLLVNRVNNKIIAAHMFGEESAEIIQMIAASIQSGATKEDFDNTMAIHPTIAEEFVTMNNLSRRY